MPRVVHFELPADDPDRAITFYETIFGWKLNKWDGPMDYWLITTGEDTEPGINGGLMRRMNPGQGVVNTINVDSVDAYASKVQAAGGKIVVPKTPVPGVGYLVYCEDTEGNVLGLMEMDESAKAE